LPANLPPQYFEAEKKYRTAKTTDEKIAALEDMLAIMPKHKGTEHLQGDLKSKIAKLKRQPVKKGPTAKKSIYDIEREGAGQAILVGPPNTGKSQLIKILTNINPLIAPYPFSTRKPNIGMMEYENIKIQLIDIPPLSADYIDPWIPNLLRNTDVIILVIDISEEKPIQQIEKTIESLKKYKIDFIRSDTAEHYHPGKVYKKIIIVCNKYDLVKNQNNYKIILQQYNNRYPVITVSSKTEENIKEFKDLIFRELEIIRVHSKAPGKEPDLNDPMIFGKGTSVLEVARSIHKDFEEKFKFAKVWGSTKFGGQKVPRDYILEDGDIIEIHI